jgi:hypothetical protein
VSIEEEEEYSISSCSLFSTAFVTRAIQTAGEREREREREREKTHKNRGSRVVKKRVEDHKMSE